jgi:hypothetical protein
MSIKPITNKEISEVIEIANAARDKWWVEELEEHYMSPDGSIIITPQKWQSRKKEIGL